MASGVRELKNKKFRVLKSWSKVRKGQSRLGSSKLVCSYSCIQDVEYPEVDSPDGATHRGLAVVKKGVYRISRC